MKDVLTSALDVATDLAREAGKIQLKHLGNIHTIVYKGEIDIVTEVDRECETLIVDGMKRHFPDHDILAEEGSGERSRSEYRWVIDPIDGTVNFAHGFPFFCVSIALEHKGQLALGVIYDPNRDELFTARDGQGAFLNGQPITVSTGSILRQSLLATGFAYKESELEANVAHFTNFIRTAQAVRRPGSAAVDLAWVACGRLDGFWEIYLKPWDMAAGVVIIREAGGMVTAFDGGTFDLYSPEILASNGNIHGEMAKVLQRGVKNKG